MNYSTFHFNCKPNFLGIKKSFSFYLLSLEKKMKGFERKKTKGRSKKIEGFWWRKFDFIHNIKFLKFEEFEIFIKIEF